MESQVDQFVATFSEMAQLVLGVVSGVETRYLMGVVIGLLGFFTFLIFGRRRARKKRVLIRLMLCGGRRSRRQSRRYVREHFTILKDGTVVHDGDLDLAGGSGPLPAMVVQGDLSFDHSAHLLKQPLIVMGDFVGHDCSIENIPDGSDIKGSVFVSRSPMTRIGRAKIGGNLYAYLCPNLIEVRAQIGGDAIVPEAVVPQLWQQCIVGGVVASLRLPVVMPSTPEE